MAGVLEDIKVLAVEHWMAIPSATAIMADWGADVIKIEDPAGGDAARGVRLAEHYPAGLPKIQPNFELDNRNKKSVAINLREAAGRQIIQELVKRSDVFASNWQARALKRFNLDYQTLAQINPKLIYISISGYGNRGPDKDSPGFDNAAFWARSGFGTILAGADGVPVPQRPAMGDHTAAMLAAGATAAALFNRDRTDLGQEISISLYHTGVWVLSQDIEISLLTGKDVSRWNRKTVGNPLANSYKAKNGKWFQVHCLQSDRHWSGFCKAIGREDLEDDPKFESSERRRENNVALISLFDEILATKTREEWGKLFDENGVIWAPIQTVAEVTTDPQALENNFFVEVDHSTEGRVKLIASPVEFSRTPATVRSHAPELGQHTEEVLLELGYTWDELVKLKEQGVII